jgi:hypothetical protein
MASGLFEAEKASSGAFQASAAGVWSPWEELGVLLSKGSCMTTSLVDASCVIVEKGAYNLSENEEAGGMTYTAMVRA